MAAASGNGTRARHGFRLVAFGGALLIGALLLAAGIGHPQPGGAAGTPAAMGTPCPLASPMATPGVTGTAMPVATPVTEATPGAAAGLRLVLLVGSEQAGPNTLTVTVADAACRPVSGATVTILTQSLDMNMGTATNKTVEQAPGQYVATGVAMGMGGRWKVDVRVERPGQPTASAEFLVILKGPM